MTKILIVEDDPFLSQMYSTKLTTSGYEIDTAEDGEKALEHIKSNKPDLVLLDIVLPKMDGIEVLKTVRATPEIAGTKIIMLSNLGQESEIERGLKEGANDYIVKSHYTPSEVVAKIIQLLEKK